jgi:hypothetical protein
MTSDSLASSTASAIRAITPTLSPRLQLETIEGERAPRERRWWPRATLLALLPCATALGCAGILGIEDAECDSSFDPECSGIPNGGSSGASGGSAGNGAAGMGGGGSGGMAGGGGGPNERPLCEQYCDRVQANCVDAIRQYASPEACLAVCALLEPGQAGALTGNSVQCRLAQAQLAGNTGEPGMHCFSAGPGGGGICGGDCEGYCTLMTQKCTQLGSYADCLAACDDVPDLSQPPSNVKYSANIDDGDSLQCRLYHVSAATLDPVLHCTHASGAAPCAP